MRESAVGRVAEFDSGWFVVRERDTRVENGQWLATQKPVSVER
jgi:hypothetical protein